MTKKQILLVEDNPSDIALTLRAFEKSGHATELVVADDGQDALDFLRGLGKWTGRDTSQVPALTLLDLKLPKVSGLDVLRAIRSHEQTRRMPVVVLSSSRESGDISATYDLGVSSYIVKAVDYKKFSADTELITTYWLSLNIPPCEAH